MVKSTLLQLKKSNPFSKLVFLFGPTGVGKTEFLLSLDSSKFSVINADSIQVYKGLDIGSAKASLEIRNKIPHYLIDVEEPRNQFSVARFIELADKACIEIANEGRVPVLCGGTAYYFKHFLYGLSEAPASDPAIRAEVERDTKEKGLAWAYEKLGKVDPVSYRRIHCQDTYRITRALEVYRACGKPLSSFAPSNQARYQMKPLVIGLTRDTAELDNRIRVRVEQMFDEGLIEEVRTLLKSGAQATWPGLQGIGYREFFEARESGECSIETIKASIVRNSRLYAKRQMTFFKSFTSVTWIGPDLFPVFEKELSLYLDT
ncbi:MAG: tRNA (adenosine(37)-N6)-dimethylallyltransferase MiaA [Sphaerochaetaceae bacterium]